MNKNTRFRLSLLVKALKGQGKRTSGFKARKQPYPHVDRRSDLAWSFGYDGAGKYIGKPWGECW